ncbi:hypothetical protein [Streptomyces sp. NPDC003015]
MLTIFTQSPIFWPTRPSFTGIDGDGQLVKEILPGGTARTVDYDARGSETESMPTSRKSPTSRRM